MTMFKFFLNLLAFTLLLPTCQYFLAKATIDSSPAMKFYPQLFLLLGFSTYFFFTLSKWANDEPKPPPNSMQAVIKLFNECGNKDYIGEEITQIEHALQAAGLAMQKIKEYPELFCDSKLPQLNNIADVIKNLQEKLHDDMGEKEENDESTNQTEDDKNDSPRALVTEEIANENDTEEQNEETEGDNSQEQIKED